MRSHIRKVLSAQSPAMTVAIVALIVALGGTATAGVTAVISLSKGEKKQVRKISLRTAEQSITRRAPGLSVAKAGSADTAASSTRAESAVSATRAESAATAGRAAEATKALSADEATNAARVGGMRAVEVNLVSETETQQTLVAEGGITIGARCSSSGQPELSLNATPGGGVLALARTDEDGDTTSFFSRNFNSLQTYAAVASAPFRVQHFSIEYVGTSGTVVTGSVSLAYDAAVAQCAIGGALFVG